MMASNDVDRETASAKDHQDVPSNQNDGHSNSVFPLGTRKEEALSRLLELFKDEEEPIWLPRVKRLWTNSKTDVQDDDLCLQADLALDCSSTSIRQATKLNNTCSTRTVHPYQRPPIKSSNNVNTIREPVALCETDTVLVCEKRDIYESGTSMKCSKREARPSVVNLAHKHIVKNAINSFKRIN